MTVAEQARLLAIVNLLAECAPPIVDGTYGNGADWCALCLKNGVWHDSPPEAHFEDCPWRQAREYEAEQKRADDGPITNTQFAQYMGRGNLMGPHKEEK